MTDQPATSLTEVLRIAKAIDAVGCRWWVEGGWGVDALVGHQTRPHRDVDLDVDAAYECEVLAALERLGYAVETDWRPTRVELAAPGRGWADVHPIELDEDGGARQAALGGGWHAFPSGWAATGSLGGRALPCISGDAQRAFRTDYELRATDRHDLAVLRSLDPSRLRTRDRSTAQT